MLYPSTMDVQSSILSEFFGMDITMDMAWILQPGILVSNVVLARFRQSIDRVFRLSAQRKKRTFLVFPLYLEMDIKENSSYVFFLFVGEEKMKKNARYVKEKYFRAHFLANFEFKVWLTGQPNHLLCKI